MYITANNVNYIIPITHQSSERKTFCGKNKTVSSTNTGMQSSLGAENLALLNKIRLIGKSQNMETYLFGGAVRDCLMNKTPHDLDIMVNGDAIEFAETLHKADSKTFNGTFLKPSVKRAIVFTDGMSIDVCSLSQNGEHLTTKAEKQAALKRKSFGSDYTINSMIIELGENESGEIKLKLIDELRAKKDLKNNLLKTVNQQEFSENPVMALRGKRYQKRYSMKTEPSTHSLIKENLSHPKSSGNPLRVAKELYKLLVEQKNPITVLRFLSNYKLFRK